MTQNHTDEMSLEDILSALHSDESRLNFLQHIYTPGNTKLADKILTINKNNFLIMKENYTSIIKKEMDYAKKTGDTSRFRQMAKKYIDYYVEQSPEYIRLNTIFWQDQEIADYALEQIKSIHGIANVEFTEALKSAAEIAHSDGKKDLEKQYLKQLLTIQEEKHLKPDVYLLIEFERFDEAIDNCLSEKGLGLTSNEEYVQISNAMSIARKHSQGRIKEVAEKGFNAFKPGVCSLKDYLDYAQELKKTEDAKKIIVEYAKNVEIFGPGEIYKETVDALLEFGREDVARSLVSRIGKHEYYTDFKGNYNYLDGVLELANLYYSVGKIDAVKNLFAREIDTTGEPKIMPLIKKAIELTGDENFFREKEIKFYERTGEFQKAATLATELKKPQLVKLYTAMNQMIEAVKTPDAK